MKNQLHEKELEFIRKNRINNIEFFLGDGDSDKGRKKLKKFLQDSNEKGFLPSTIAEFIGKDRHVLHQWYKRYRLKSNYHGFKKSIISITLDKSNHDTKSSTYLILDDVQFRIFTIHANTLFAYFVGLILGDGSIDPRKIYITGGGTNDFLDAIRPKALEFAKHLGDRKIAIKYYENDKEIERKEKCSWRLYFYWSALSNMFRHKGVFEKTLEKLWNDPELFNAFTAGLFDADGYFVLNHGRPGIIGIEQRQSKTWFVDFIERLQEKYSIRVDERTRKYSITKYNGKIYQGVTKARVVRFTMRSWPGFIDDIITPYSNKHRHLNRSKLFREHALKSQKRWRV